MVVTICILSVLLLLSLIIIYIGWQVILNLAVKNITDEDYFNLLLNKDNIEEAFENVTVLVYTTYNPNFNGLMYDFSRYEDSNIIGVYGSYQEFRDLENGVILTNQTVYKLKSGGFQWDYRALL